MRLEFGLLGPTVVIGDAGEIPVQGAIRRTLLARLLVARGGPVAVDVLREDLWDGDPPASAASTLKSHVSLLRRSLGPGRIDAGGGAYTLHLEADELDVNVFEKEAAEGRELLRHGDAARAHDSLERGLGRWRGRALAEVAGTGWARAEAVRIEELRAAALECWLEARARSRRDAPGRARCRSRGGRATHPRAAVGEAHDSALPQRQAGRLFRAYQRLRMILGDELGIEPSPDLVRLEASILAQDPSLDALPAPSPRRRHASGNLPPDVNSFVERPRELADMARILEQPCLLTLTGPGGTGKTRLAVEVDTDAPRRTSTRHGLCDLGPVSEPPEVLRELAMVLGCTDHAGTDLADVVGRRLGLGSQLVIVDNCEHLLDSCANLAERLRRDAPSSRVVATSRSPLARAARSSTTCRPCRCPRQAAETTISSATSRCSCSSSAWPSTRGVLPRRRQLARRGGDLPTPRRCPTGHRAGSCPPADNVSKRRRAPSRRPLRVADNRVAYRPCPPAHAAGTDRLVVRTARPPRAAAVRPISGVCDQLRRGRRGGRRRGPSREHGRPPRLARRPESCPVRPVGTTLEVPDARNDKALRDPVFPPGGGARRETGPRQALRRPGPSRDATAHRQRPPRLALQARGRRRQPPCSLRHGAQRGPTRQDPRIRSRLCRYWSSRGSFGDEMALVESALNTPNTAGSTPAWRCARCGSVHVLPPGGDRRAQERIDEALAIAEELGLHALAADVLRTAAWVADRRGDAAVAATLASRAVEAALSSGKDHLIAARLRRQGGGCPIGGPRPSPPRTTRNPCATADFRATSSGRPPPSTTWGCSSSNKVTTERLVRSSRRRSPSRSESEIRRLYLSCATGWA